MKITKGQLKEILKKEIRETLEEGSEDWASRLGLKVTPKQAEAPPQQDSAKQILKNVAAELAQIEDLDAISEDEAMDILDVVIDGMQQMLHVGGFGTSSPVGEEPGSLSEYGGYSGNFGGVAGALGAVAGRREPPSLDNEADSVVQEKALEFFMNLGLEQKVCQTMIARIAINDLKAIMLAIPKIGTAAEDEDEQHER